MLEVNVNINAPEIAAAINNLAAVFGSAQIKAKRHTDGEAVPLPYIQPSPDVTPVTISTTPAIIPVTAATENTATQSPATPVPVQPESPTPPAAPVQAQPAPSVSVPTIEAISRAGAALCEQGKMPQLIDLLGRYGVQAVTQLKGATDDVLLAFAGELKALGANL